MFCQAFVLLLRRNAWGFAFSGKGSRRGTMLARQVKRGRASPTDRLGQRPASYDGMRRAEGLVQKGKKPPTAAAVIGETGVAG